MGMGREASIHRLVGVGGVNADDQIVGVRELAPSAVLAHRAREQPRAARTQLVLVHAQHAGALREKGQLQGVAAIRDRTPPASRRRESAWSARSLTEPPP